MADSTNLMHYESNHQIIINGMSDSIYYYFDYDERSEQVNMDFQHFHIFHEIHILLSPKAHHLIEGIPYSIENGDVVLLRPSLLHKTVYPKGAPSKRLIINFLYPQEYLDNHPGIKTLLESFSAPLPIYRFDERMQRILVQPLNDILALSRHPISDELRQTMVHNRFLDFLYQLWTMRNYSNYVADDFDNELSAKVYQISSYIHTHYSENLSLEEISKKFYISPHYLSHQFSSITGYTLTHYIQMTRVRNAQYALLNSKEKISDIAVSCGFSSFSQFNRVFQKFTGISPSAYRGGSPISAFRKSSSSE
ncbi:MAG: AraC family transcriptional regulator [Lachnospiraceae bacterium]|nr:AraC family transcriptional regulator [Lachnospiraceae bacterium]